MSAANCLRCLLRPSPVALIQRRVAPVLISTIPSRSISSTPVVSAAAAKNDGVNRNTAGRPQKIKKNYKKGKGQQQERVRPPAPGERKAYRKRILLSNDNAVPVAGLPELNAHSLLEPANAGKVLAIPNDLVDQLRAIEAFKTTQTWGMFRRPSMLLRAETLELARRMQDAVRKKETLRLVIKGDRVSGKSMLLLQAMSHAYMQNWIVFSVPEGEPLPVVSKEGTEKRC